MMTAMTLKGCPPLLCVVCQVANQQGIYLARGLNSGRLTVTEGASEAAAAANPFKYRHLGSMASVGDWKGVYDSTDLGIVLLLYSCVY